MLLLQNLTVLDFLPLVGQEFRMEYPDYAETLRLVEAKPSPAPAGHGFRPGFSLFFEGESRTVMLGQAIYPLTNPALGELAVTLTPVGRLPAGNFRYQVVFG